MNICSLKLRNFRNYDMAECVFRPNSICILEGKNAQGKTNLIESIYYLSHLRSFRTPSSSSLILENQDFFMIQAQIESHQRKEELKIVSMDHEKHLYRLNDPIRRYSDFIGIVNAVLFCPDDLMLFQQSPKIRRRFIDMELIKISKRYTSTLNHYQKMLKERNSILKREKVDPVLLETMTEQMIQDQIIILKQRVSFLEDLMEKTRTFYSYFTKEKEEVGARYQTFVSMDDLETNLRNAYKKSEMRDKLYKQTHIGIHKDDIDFHMNGISVKEIASQGQKRSFVLSMKLALCQIIYEKQKEYPILLLDDVFSELDDHRCQKLISILPQKMQIFITTTGNIEPSWLKDHKAYTIQVENGHLREVKK